MNEVLRQEKKFLIDQVQLYRYSRGLAQFLTEDPHNKGGEIALRPLEGAPGAGVLQGLLLPPPGGKVLHAGLDGVFVPRLQGESGL